jgi:two-component system, NarL family, sensor kinase
VSLRLTEEDGYIVLSIHDDGRGFDESALADRVADGHIGLAAHRARIENVGGTLTVARARAGGTSAEVRVPRA